MDPYLGEVRVFGFNYAPEGWVKCDGQLLEITKYQALYALLGTAYGGDGRNTFGVPDLRGRAAVSQAPGYPRGLAAGTEYIGLTTDQLPRHNHSVYANSTTADASEPTTTTVPAETTGTLYAPGIDLAAMHAQMVLNTGQGDVHSNMQPSTVLNFCMATTGLFPPRD